MKNFTLAFSFLLLLAPARGQFTNILISPTGCTEPSICIDPTNTNRMVAATNCTYSYYSGDGGQTWAPCTGSITPGLWCYDASIVADTNGHFYYFHNYFAGGYTPITVQKSFDGGQNWTFDNNVPDLYDKEMACVSPFTNELYTAYIPYTTTTDVGFSMSSNSGIAWSPMLEINAQTYPDIQFGAAPSVGLAPGEVYVVWANYSGIYFQKSTDNGISWQTSDQNVSAFFSANNQFNCMPSISTDLGLGTYSGNIYLCWYEIDPYGTDTDIYLAKSNDNGWTWMQGSQTSNVPVYGTYQVLSVSNSPGFIQECSATWVDEGGDLWFYGGSNQNSAMRGVLWRYDLETNQWAWMGGSTIPNANPVYGTLGIPDSANHPGGRICYASWKDHEGNFMLFGGGIPSECYNDLWKYDLASGMWTWIGGTSLINPPGNSGNGCQLDSSFIPAGRYENRAVAVDTCGKVWMYGGLAFFFGTRSDLWIYRPQENDWAWITGSLSGCDIPSYGSLGVSDTVNHPGGRGGAGMWFDHSGNLWLFGGMGYSQTCFDYMNDLWKFEPGPECIVASCLITTYNDIFLANEFSISPIPVSGVATIQFETAGHRLLSLSNSLGELLLQTETTSTTFELDVSHFTAGVYFVTVKDENGNGVTKKVIKM